ncbi:MAG: transporter associated domain-containing protein, partial [Phycisphaerales bacterium]
MLTWYVLDSSGEAPRPDGPFPFEHLAKLAASGALNVSSMVARAGSDRWVAAGDDPELAGIFRAAPPTESFAPSGAAGLATPAFAAPIEASYSFGNAFDLAVRTVKSQWGPLVLAGLVTLEDCLEELVGEIVDEYDIEEHAFQRLPDGDFLVDGGMAIDEVNELLGGSLPDDDWDTLAGLVFSSL